MIDTDAVRSYQPFTRLDKPHRAPHGKSKTCVHFSVWMETADYIAFKAFAKAKKKSMSRLARRYIKDGMKRDNK